MACLGEGGNVEVLNTAAHMIETPEGRETRREVLVRLSDIAQSWIDSETTGPKSFGKVCTFGSYRLGVEAPDADIDTLIVAPRHINRGMFFTSFLEHLCADPHVFETVAIPDAFVPVIKCVIEGIALDVVFAQVPLDSVPDTIDLFEDSLLEGAGRQTIRSVNAVRVADTIRNSVPILSTFCSTLRTVKLWAQQRLIYSNVFGYLGGVSWAIMVCRVCQEHPTLSAAELVVKFFSTYASWEWPNPVTLLDFVTVEPPSLTHLHDQDWTVKREKVHSFDLIPILTPAFPSMNTAHNISPTTFRVLKRELKRGHTILSEAPELDMGSLLSLVSVSDFFRRHPLYLCVTASAKTACDHREWLGWVESKMRHLVEQVAHHPYLTCHPCPPRFASPLRPHCHSFFLGLEVHKSDVDVRRVNLNAAVSNFQFLVCETYSKRKPGMQVDVVNLLPGDIRLLWQQKQFEQKQDRFHAQLRGEAGDEPDRRISHSSSSASASTDEESGDSATDEEHGISRRRDWGRPNAWPVPRVLFPTGQDQTRTNSEHRPQLQKQPPRSRSRSPRPTNGAKSPKTTSLGVPQWPARSSKLCGVPVQGASTRNTARFSPKHVPLGAWAKKPVIAHVLDPPM